MRISSVAKWTTLAMLSVAAGSAMALPPPLPPMPQQPVQAVGSNGELIFEQSEIDLGERLDNEPAVADFRFKSVGPGSVNVIQVKTDCGCTVAKLIKITKNPDTGEEVQTEVDPNTTITFAEGDEGLIRATYDAHKRSGPASRHIRLTTDNPKAKSVVATLKINVVPLVPFEPRVVTFGNNIFKGVSASRTLEVYGRIPTFNVTKATFSNLLLNEKIKVEIGEVQDKEYAGQMMKMVPLTLTVQPGLAPGPFNDKLYVRTTDERQPMVEVQVMGRVLGDLEIEPPLLRLGRMVPSEPIEREVHVRSRSATPFHISGVELATGTVKIEQVATPDDPTNPNAWTIKLTITPTSEDGQLRNEPLIINTDVPQEEKTELRTYGVIMR